MARKLTDKQKRLKKEQEERRMKNKLEKSTIQKHDTSLDKEDLTLGIDIEPNEAWLDIGYGEKKRFDIYEDYIKTYKMTNVFIRDIDFENYNYFSCAYNEFQELRDFSVDYKGDNAFLCEIAHYIKCYRCRKYKDACLGLSSMFEKYPKEGWLYYYYGRAFSYAYRGGGNGELYSLRFFKRAVELNGYIEMYLEYANMLWECGNILVRSDMPLDAEKLYRCSIEVYDEAEKKYPECGDIKRMREYVPVAEKTGISVDSFSMKNYTFDNESREWLTENLLFPVDQDLLL